MNRIKVTLKYDGVNDQRTHRAVEANLARLPSVEIQAIGLDRARLTADQSMVSGDDMQRAIEQAGGILRSIEQNDDTRERPLPTGAKGGLR
jgi:hypothetical protein